MGKFILIHLDEKWNDIKLIEKDFFSELLIFQKKMRRKIVISSNKNNFIYYKLLKKNLKNNKDFIFLENLNLNIFERIISFSSLSISCHSGFLVQIAGFNKTSLIDIINKKDFMWYSCWKPLNTNHKFIFKSNGLYIDVGCNHPVYNNNTYLLYKKGWRGINLDIDKKSIDLFNIFRKGDLNLNYAISSKETELEYINYHEKSPINRIKTKLLEEISHKEIKKIKSKTLNSIIENSPFHDQKFDFVTIDVEGHEIEVIDGFNLIKYKPSIVVIEYLDTSLNKIDIKNFSLKNVINSEIYKKMIESDYNMVNWLHSDLIFAHNSFKDKLK